MHVLYFNKHLLDGAMDVVMTCTQVGGMLVCACGQV